MSRFEVAACIAVGNTAPCDCHNIISLVGQVRGIQSVWREYQGRNGLEWSGGEIVVEEVSCGGGGGGKKKLKFAICSKRGTLPVSPSAKKKDRLASSY